MVLNPGDEFSYNTALGKRTIEAGYQAAGAYNNGEVVEITSKLDEIEYENGENYLGFRHYDQILDFYNAVINDVQPKISGEDALKIQKLICEIYKNGNFTKAN